MVSNARSTDFVKLPKELEESADALMRWALANVPDTPNRAPSSAAFSLLRLNMQKRMLSSEVGLSGIDHRRAFYGLRVVLLRTDNEIVDKSGWEHDIFGLSNVWRAVEEMGMQLHPQLAGACPMELRAEELTHKDNQVRVYMSRTANKIAAFRVPYTIKVMEKSLRIGGPAVERAYDFILRIDVGASHETRVLDQQERAAGSPLVVN